MESAEQPFNDLIVKVNDSLNKDGHASTIQSVNPHDESALEPIKRDFHNLIGSAMEEITGAGNAVHVRTTKGRVATLIDKFRRKQKTP